MTASTRFSHHLREGAFRLSPRRRWMVYCMFALLLVTGLAWLVVHFLDDGSDAGALTLAWSMKLHGGAVMLTLLLLGMLWGPHIRNAWVRKRNRAAGAVVGAVVLVLILTGYALYYVNGQLVRQIAEYLHWFAGVTMCLALWAHIVVGRRKRKKVS